MAPISSKRRKLDHNNEHSKLEDNESENSDAESQSSHNSPGEAPGAAQSKQTQTKPPKRAQDNDSAIYDGGLSKSSLFKLQVDELLTEVQPNYEKKLSGVDDALRKLKSLIEGIEDRDALPISEATKALYKSHKIAIPFPDPKPDKNAAYKLAYARPSNINVVGSYVLKTMAKSDTVLSIDMVVIMPATIFQEKDYLNYRYFYKRSYYLACIAAGLQEALKGEYTLEFRFLNGNSLHPILVMRPKPEKIKSDPPFEINIIPAAPRAFFPESKLLPSKNSIRAKESQDGESTTQSPTPFYNASIRSDCNFESYLTLLNSTMKLSSAFKNACILGRIWLRQRGFSSDHNQGGFGHFEWAALTALLLKGGGPKGRSLLSPGYSSYQMFKAVVQFLSGNDLSAKPLVYETENFVASKSGMPMFYDGPRGQNLLYKMTPWSYKLLRDEARASLDMLNDVTFDQFESTFILRTSQTMQRYDCLVEAKFTTLPPKSNSSDHASAIIRFGSKIFDILREGLSDRVKTINIQVQDQSSSSWPLKSSYQSPDLGEKTVLVEAVFDPANIDRLVDHGPPAEDKKKAASFRKFWGEKAELRRFKDGSILESLVWSPGSNYAIFTEIVTYLWTRHIDPMAATNLTFTGQSFDKLLPGSRTSTKSFDALKEAYLIFEKQVRDLESLPLQLRQLSPIDPQLRYSSIVAPFFTATKSLKNPAEVMIQFEGSGRWPDDILAIQRTKIAFLLKIASLLKTVDSNTKTRLGLENEDSTLLNCAFLDIIYESGASFRLRIHNDREQVLLERQIKNKTSDNHARQEAVAALSTYKHFFIQLPLLSQSINTHCTRFPLLSPTIRLVKMWFDQHMLSSHMSEELIELIVARTFLQPYPWQAPSSTMTGFLRTLLFISKWDWRLTPLIVDFTGTMTSTEIETINTRLEAWRKIDPAMNRTVLIAGSNHDMTGTAFTDNGPSKMVAARMTALARSACKLVKEKGKDLDHKSLFVSSTADYDFVIHISPTFAPKHAHKEQKFKNLEVQEELNVEMVGYEPLQEFVAELERLYGDAVVFFYARFEGDVIGGLWNPAVVGKRGFRINLGFASKVVEGEGDGKEENGEMVELDKSAILAEIARLGGDMVKSVDVRK